MREWLEVLEAECLRTSQNKTARRLGYSAAVINQVLKGSYKGDFNAVKRRVQQILMRDEVKCPVLGFITGEECGHNQRKPFNATNSMRARLYKACRVCWHREQNDG